MVDVVVVGAQKCGLCSTRTWLKNFPELEVYPWEYHGWTWTPDKAEESKHSSEWREVLESPVTDKGASNLIRDFLRAQRTLDPWESEDRIRGLSGGDGQRGKRVLVTPGLSMMDARINARILAAVNSEMTVVLLVRDPVERAYISWNQFNKAFPDKPDLHDPRSFELAIEEGLRDREDPAYSFVRPYRDQYVAAGEYGRIQQAFAQAGLGVYWASLPALASEPSIQSEMLETVFGLKSDNPPTFPHVHNENPTVPLDEDSKTARKLRDHYRHSAPLGNTVGGYDSVYGFGFEYERRDETRA